MPTLMIYLNFWPTFDYTILQYAINGFDIMPIIYVKEQRPSYKWNITVFFRNMIFCPTVNGVRKDLVPLYSPFTLVYLYFYNMRSKGEHKYDTIHSKERPQEEHFFIKGFCIGTFLIFQIEQRRSIQLHGLSLRCCRPWLNSSFVLNLNGERCSEAKFIYTWIFLIMLLRMNGLSDPFVVHMDPPIYTICKDRQRRIQKNSF